MELWLRATAGGPSASPRRPSENILVHVTIPGNPNPRATDPLSPHVWSGVFEFQRCTRLCLLQHSDVTLFRLAVFLHIQPRTPMVRKLQVPAPPLPLFTNFENFKYNSSQSSTSSIRSRPKSRIVPQFVWDSYIMPHRWSSG